GHDPVPAHAVREAGCNQELGVAGGVPVQGEPEHAASRQGNVERVERRAGRCHRRTSGSVSRPCEGAVRPPLGLAVHASAIHDVLLPFLLGAPPVFIDGSLKNASTSSNAAWRSSSNSISARANASGSGGGPSSGPRSHSRQHAYPSSTNGANRMRSESRTSTGCAMVPPQVGV